MCLRFAQSVSREAELSGSEKVEQNHVKIAQHQIEADQMTPVIAKLPNQQKVVLAAILINEKNGLKNIQTGESLLNLLTSVSTSGHECPNSAACIWFDFKPRYARFNHSSND